MAKWTIKECGEARAALLKLLKPGQQVYTVLKHRSSSGMSRVIDVVIIATREHREYPPASPEKARYPGDRDYDAEPKVRRSQYIGSIGYLVAKATGHGWDDRRGGVSMGGCGMDMGFALVYSLGSALWPNGTRQPHGTRNGQPDRDGGYALKQEWL